VGEEKRQEKFAGEIKAAQQFAHCNCRNAEICRRNDHRSFEVLAQQKIISRSNTFESLSL
jgi:hypothetical protein